MARIDMVEVPTDVLQALIEMRSYRRCGLRSTTTLHGKTQLCTRRGLQQLVDDVATAIDQWDEQQLETIKTAAELAGPWIAEPVLSVV